MCKRKRRCSWWPWCSVALLHCWDWFYHPPCVCAKVVKHRIFRHTQLCNCGNKFRRFVSFLLLSAINFWQAIFYDSRLLAAGFFFCIYIHFFGFEPVKEKYSTQMAPENVSWLSRFSGLLDTWVVLFSSFSSWDDVTNDNREMTNPAGWMLLKY